MTPPPPPNSGHDDARIDDLLSLAALGELDEAQAAELDALLAADAELAADLDADLEIAALLQAAAPVAPPEQVKRNVMAAIDELGAPVTSLDVARSRRTSKIWTMVGSAAAVALVAVGAFVVLRDGGLTVQEVTSAADARERVFVGDLTGSLSVVHSPTETAFVLVGDSVPPVGPDQTYQLWFVSDAGAESIGLFRPDDDGRVAELFDDLDPTAVTVGITIEPAAGSDQPTLPIVATA